ncbi:MAG: Ku protein [Phreatobacter sp.]|nr:Ku protein [Phreatobacter sp.]
MADRAFWKGYLKLSLVTCPVAMAPATTESEKVRFHTLSRKTGNRVESRYVDSETGTPVEDDDQSRGYAAGEDEFVILEDEDLEAITLETTRTIDIEQFVPRHTIPWIYLDKPHFLMPNDPVGEEAFTVIREAMATSRVVGIARLVLYRRERAVMLEPRGKGIIVWTLRYGDEVRDKDAYFEAAADDAPPSKAMVLARSLIKERTRKWSPTMVEDPVQDALLSLIKSKKASRPPRKGATKAQDGDNVVDLFAALRKSLGASGKKPPASRGKRS